MQQGTHTMTSKALKLSSSKLFHNNECTNIYLRIDIYQNWRKIIKRRTDCHNKSSLPPSFSSDQNKNMRMLLFDYTISIHSALHTIHDIDHVTVRYWRKAEFLPYMVTVYMNLAHSQNKLQLSIELQHRC